MPTEVIDPPADPINPVQKAFDKWSMEPTKPAAEPVKPVAASEPVKPIPEPAKSAEPIVEPQKSTLPSFLESEPAKPAETVVAEEWPEELPGVEDPKQKANWSKFRAEHSANKKEIERLKSEYESVTKKTKDSEASLARVAELEKQNKELSAVAERVGVESSSYMQNLNGQIKGAYDTAAGIVKDAGGELEPLQKALRLTGKARYEALDEVYSGLPESAKSELATVIRDIGLFVKQRQSAMDNVHVTAENLKKAELIGQKKQMEQKQSETKEMLDGLITEMRDVHKLEVLQKSSNPKDKEWNDGVDQLEKNVKDFLLGNNYDERKFAAAVTLGFTVDKYRQLFRSTLERATKAEKELAQRDAAVPILEPDGGPRGAPTADINEDFGKAFILGLHKARNK